MSIKVKSGVPQGSVLGPCLFLVYINDLPQKLSSPVRLFADDTALTRKIITPNDPSQLQEDIDLLTEWEHRWSMSFHPQKCSYLPVSRAKSPSTRQYSMHDHTMEQVSSTKYLGVTIQSDLSWSQHINQVSAKANRTLAFLRRNLKTAPTGLKSKAYKALVRPLFEYTCTVWDPHTQKLVDQLEAVQRRAARFALNDYRSTSSVSGMLSKLEWTPLQERRKCLRLSMLGKIIKNQVSVKSNLKPLPPRSRRGHSNQFQLVQCRTLYRQNSFFPRTIADWNALTQSELEGILNKH